MLTPAQALEAPWVLIKGALTIQPGARACQSLGHSFLLGWTSDRPRVREYKEFSCH